MDKVRNLVMRADNKALLEMYEELYQKEYGNHRYGSKCHHRNGAREQGIDKT